MSFWTSTCRSPPVLVWKLIAYCNKLLKSAHFHPLDALTTRLPSVNLNDCLQCLSSALLYMKGLCPVWICEYFVLMLYSYARFVQAIISLSSWFLQCNPLFNWTPVIALKYLCHLFVGGWRWITTQRRLRYSGWEHDISGKILGNFLKSTN